MTPEICGFQEDLQEQSLDSLLSLFLCLWIRLRYLSETRGPLALLLYCASFSFCICGPQGQSLWMYRWRSHTPGTALPSHSVGPPEQSILRKKGFIYFMQSPRRYQKGRKKCIGDLSWMSRILYHHHCWKPPLHFLHLSGAVTSGRSQKLLQAYSPWGVYPEL